jgi:hypothetical protein
LTDVAVDFFLPSIQSRWHLVGVAFHPPEGASEPVFAQVDYPSGSGVARTAIDDARIVNAMGRFAAVRLSFDVGEGGVPDRFRVEKASEDFWGIEAFAVVQNWRFKPGEKNGIPVSVPTTVDMIWGERVLTASPLEILRALTSPDPQLPSDAACRTNRAVAIYSPARLQAAQRRTSVSGLAALVADHSDESKAIYCPF